jgi:hypothetical protein
MVKVARNFECEFTGSFCEDAKCKRGFCELERKEKTAFAQLHADEDLANAICHECSDQSL